MHCKQCIIFVIYNILKLVIGIQIKIAHIEPYDRFMDMRDWAFRVAVHNAQQEGFVYNHSISVVTGLTRCRGKNSVETAIELFETENVIGFIGIQCSNAIVPVGYYASHENFPLFSVGGSSMLLNDKQTYDTLVRIRPGYHKIGAAFAEIFREFKWKLVTVIESSSPWQCQRGAGNIKENLRKYQIEIAEWNKIHRFDRLTDQEVDQILNSIKIRSRIVIFCARESDLHRFMSHAHKLHMTNGEYVFIHYQLYWTEELKRPWLENKNVTEEEKMAYDSLKVLTTWGLNEHDAIKFIDDSKKYVKENSLNLTVNDEDPVGALLVYDATSMYLQILDDLIQESKDIRDGKEIFKRVANKEFKGHLGPVIFDSVADREPDFAIWHYNRDIDSFEFWTQISPYKPAGQRYVEPNVSFWTFGDIPPDRPICGFKNELCASDDKDTTTIIAAVVSVGLVTLLCAVIFTFWRRKITLENTLKEMLWKIKYDEIQRTNTANSIMGGFSRQSMLSHSKHSRRLNVQQKPHSTEIGIYKGHIVAIRHISSKAMKLSRKDLILLNAMRSFSHENVATFLGACVDVPNICTITIYCPKGTLSDILDNEDIKLDWSFKTSLINDLVNGLRFIHNSLLGSHGRLMSSSCLVDSRWVLKISEFERQVLKRDYGENYEGEFHAYFKLLWTAPELLRLPNVPPQGTSKGDIYSVAIIMQEIIFRQLPYFIKDIEPKEVIGNIKDKRNTPFRPNLPDNPEAYEKGTIFIMKMCWAEDPNNRPTIETLLALLKNSNGSNVNVLDNMVMKMEKYAENLEQIVAQRSSALIDEKIKTDALLYRLLPKSVAEDLKTGKSLTAEMFDSVSVYFSDIVGFTKLSSDCTPMQIVVLLNHLYSVFDSTIDKHDVYKVETIGDAYMVVGGVPQKKNKHHIVEISNMALDLRHELYHFTVKGWPDIRVQLRSGIHTGPCAAGVVGITMPRYCLFGDTINIASKMESTGKAMMIQMSKEAYEALTSITLDYAVEPRYDDVRADTFWLSGKK